MADTHRPQLDAGPSGPGLPSSFVEGLRAPLDWLKERTFVTQCWAIAGLFVVEFMLDWQQHDIALAITVGAAAGVIVTLPRHIVTARRGDGKLDVARFAALIAGTVLSSTAVAAVIVPVARIVAKLLVFAAVLAALWVVLRVVFSSEDDIDVGPRGANSHVNSNGTPKIVYGSMSAAEDAAADYYRDRGESMSAYKCGTCSGFHIGHTSH